MGQIIFRIIVILVMLGVLYLLMAVIASAAGWGDPLGLVGEEDDDDE